MDETKDITSSSQPSSQGDKLVDSPRRVLGLMVVSLLLPPLGVVAVLWLLRRLTSTPKQQIVVALMALVASIAGAAGYNSLYQSFLADDNRSNQVPARYLNQQMDTYKVEGRTKGTAISFQKPAQVVEVLAKPGYADLRPVFKDPKVQDNTTVTVIRVSAELSKTPLNKRLGEINEINSTFRQMSSDYNKIKQPIDDFVTKALGPNYKVNVGSPQPFTFINPDKDTFYSWSFDFTATKDFQFKSETKQEKIKGKLVYVLSKNSSYYFLIGAADILNLADTHIKQVLDSLKVDQ